MVGLAAAGVGAIARAGIIVTARISAIGRLNALGTAAGVAGKKMGGMGGNALAVAGQVSILSAALKLLTNPVSGILAALQLGLSTRNFVIFDRAMRRARFRADLMGLSTNRLTQSLRNLRGVMGAANAQEFVKTSESFAKFASLSDDQQLALATIAERLKLTGESWTSFVDLATAAWLGEAGAFEALKAQFPEIGKEIKTTTKLIELINEASMDPGPVTNAERIAESYRTVQGELMPILGQLGDWLLIIPLIAAKITEFSILFLLNIGKNVKDAIFGVFQVFFNLAGIITNVIDSLTGFNDRTPMESLRKGGQKVLDALNKVIDAIQWLSGFKFVENVLNWAVFDPVADAVSEIWNFIQNIKILKDLIDNIKTTTGDIWTTFWTETIPNAAQVAWDTIKASWNDLWNTDIFQIIKDVGSKIGNWITSHIITPIKSAIDSLVGIVQGIIDKILEALGLISGLLGSVGGTGGFNVPGFESGGIVPGPLGRPQLIMAHGGERVIPHGGNQEQPLIQVFIGNEQVDAVVNKSLTRTMRFRAGIGGQSAINSP